MNLLRPEGYKIFPVCPRLYDGDNEARDAMKCRIRGQKRGYQSSCDQCGKVGRPFANLSFWRRIMVALTCILTGRQMPCTARGVDDEYEPKKPASVARKMRGDRDEHIGAEAKT